MSDVCKYSAIYGKVSQFSIFVLQSDSRYKQDSFASESEHFPSHYIADLSFLLLTWVILFDSIGFTYDLLQLCVCAVFAEFIDLELISFRVNTKFLSFDICQSRAERPFDLRSTRHYNAYVFLLCACGMIYFWEKLKLIYSLFGFIIQIYEISIMITGSVHALTKAHL